MLRRRVLLIGGAALATGIGLDVVLTDHRRSEPGGAAPARPAAPDPALEAAVRDEQALIARYVAATRRFPAVAAVLAVPAAHHRQHLAALTAAPGATIPSGASGTGTGTATATATLPRSSAPPAPASSPTLRQELASLRAAELAAAQARAAAAVRDLAHGGLLASVAAAEAVHVDLLTALAASAAAR